MTGNVLKSNKVSYCVVINSNRKVTITLSSYSCCVRAFATLGSSQSIDVMYSDGYLSKNVVGTWFDASVSSDDKIEVVDGDSWLLRGDQTCTVESVPI